MLRAQSLQFSCALPKEKSSFQKFFFQKFSNFVTIVSNWFLVESVHNKPMLWILKNNEGSMVMCTEIEDLRSACLLPLIGFMIWGPGLDLHFSSISLFFFNFVFSKNYFVSLQYECRFIYFYYFIFNLSLICNF